MTNLEEMSPFKKKLSAWIRDEPRFIRDISRICNIVAIVSIVVSTTAVLGTIYKW